MESQPFIEPQPQERVYTKSSWHPNVALISFLFFVIGLLSGGIGVYAFFQSQLDLNKSEPKKNEQVVLASPQSTVDNNPSPIAIGSPAIPMVKSIQLAQLSSTIMVPLDWQLEKIEELENPFVAEIPDPTYPKYVLTNADKSIQLIVTEVVYGDGGPGEIPEYAEYVDMRDISNLKLLRMERSEQVYKEFLNLNQNQIAYVYGIEYAYEDGENFGMFPVVSLPNHNRDASVVVIFESREFIDWETIDQMVLSLVRE